MLRCLLLLAMLPACSGYRPRTLPEAAADAAAHRAHEQYVAALISSSSVELAVEYGIRPCSRSASIAWTSLGDVPVPRNSRMGGASPEVSGTAEAPGRPQLDRPTTRTVRQGRKRRGTLQGSGG